MYILYTQTHIILPFLYSLLKEITFLHLYSSFYISIYILYIIFYQYIGLAVRVFTNGPGNRGSIPDQIIPKTQKMVLDATLLNTQHYKLRIKGKVE